MELVDEKGKVSIHDIDPDKLDCSLRTIRYDLHALVNEEKLIIIRNFRDMRKVWYASKVQYGSTHRVRTDETSFHCSDTGSTTGVESRPVQTDEVRVQVPVEASEE